MKKISLLPALLVGIVFTLLSCAASKQSSLLNSDDFATKMKKQNTVLLDVRTPAEYDSAHIPGSLLINYKDTSFTNKVLALDKSKTYLVYCHAGRRSDAAAKIMTANGGS